MPDIGNEENQGSSFSVLIRCSNGSPPRCSLQLLLAQKTVCLRTPEGNADGQLCGLFSFDAHQDYPLGFGKNLDCWEPTPRKSQTCQMWDRNFQATGTGGQGRKPLAKANVVQPVTVGVEGIDSSSKIPPRIRKKI